MHAKVKRSPLTLQVREQLLESLGAQPGQVSVRRHRATDGDEILIIAYPSSPLTAADVPSEYSGYPVRFERHKIPKAG
jgi:hypothetical protein